ncbi:bifunctional phosphatase PAP2/diacylglycerol kinase family protein [Streptomyces hoynatensis]|uniref:Phosphatase PAP2 family protein n=1 Tax=Streptomyces hoynatensis TaxID=1141874 RepID=A0A3A9YR91_9ACTN|nr:phosphatase PAP2 family protein [Streptomyces hoynatensis]RKN38528.1 phosphatase PAP2 family protein [Streptomyces hoynatensis]
MGWVERVDQRVFDRVAAAHPPGLQTVLPRLSLAADHSRLWLGTAAALAALGNRPARRAALRGVGALALASLATNTVVKYVSRRERPLIDAVPLARRLHRQPKSTSFPSGHAASAAAFATGVAMESRRHGLLVAPFAAAVAASRVYVGVHYPADVLAGCAIGVGAALATSRWLPRRPPVGQFTHRQVSAPALPRGAGLCVVVNAEAAPGSAPAADRIRALLPEAEVVEHRAGEDLGALFDAAAERAAALGVCGGDGSVNAAAARSAERGLPLAVFPGGTLNHFALDTGLRGFEDTAEAVDGGQAVGVDLGRIRPAPGEGGEEAGCFLNTFSLGLYPELVHAREELRRRSPLRTWSKWPSAAISLVHVLRTAEPFEVRVNGRSRRLWLLFAGNGLYSPEGFAPSHRTQLDDGLLDVRTVTADKPLARTRLALAALTGTLPYSRIHDAVRLPRLRLAALPQGSTLAFDGETATAPAELLLDKHPAPLVLYRSAPEDPR